MSFQHEDQFRSKFFQTDHFNFSPNILHRASEMLCQILVIYTHKAQWNVVAFGLNNTLLNER
jgi:hypothetical protein